jgi:transcription antitermination factor NusG
MNEGARWYVVRAQPQNELRAELNLRRQGFATYLQRYYRGIIERVAGDRRVAVLLELFGREVRVFVPAASVGAN